MLIGFVLVIIILINLVTIFLLSQSKNKLYITDTVFFIISLAFAAAASVSGHVLLYAGTLVYAAFILKPGNIFTTLILYSGFIIGYLMNNNFYSYSSLLFIFLFSLIRWAEAFVDMYQIAKIENKNPSVSD